MAEKETETEMDGIVDELQKIVVVVHMEMEKGRVVFTTNYTSRRWWTKSTTN